MERSPKAWAWAPATLRGWEKEQEPAKGAEKWPGRWQGLLFWNSNGVGIQGGAVSPEEETQMANKNMKSCVCGYQTQSSQMKMQPPYDVTHVICTKRESSSGP